MKNQYGLISVTNSIYNIISLVDIRKYVQMHHDLKAKACSSLWPYIHSVSKSGELDNHGSTSVFSVHRTNPAIP
jgi:hypothetical protein